MHVKNLTHPSGLQILMYHRVLAQPDPFREGDPTVRDFARQMQVVRRWFQPLDLVEAAERLQAGTLPPRACVITFDDGYLDNLTLAAPILKSLGIPATVFVASGFGDGRNMWNDVLIDAILTGQRRPLELMHFGLGRYPCPDPKLGFVSLRPLLNALKPLPPDTRESAVADCAAQLVAAPAARLMLGEEEIRSLQQAGVRIGAHTVSHPILNVLDDAAAKAEILESKRTLESVTGGPIEVFAYPNGRPQVDYGPRDVELVANAGFVCAVSTRAALALAQDSPYELPRYGLWSHHPARFGLQLTRRFLAEGQAAMPARAQAA